jgi:hypothetical protein
MEYSNAVINKILADKVRNLSDKELASFFVQQTCKTTSDVLRLLAECHHFTSNSFAPPNEIELDFVNEEEKEEDIFEAEYEVAVEEVALPVRVKRNKSYISDEEYDRLTTVPANELRGEINKLPNLTKSDKTGLINQIKCATDPEYREKCNARSRESKRALSSKKHEDSSPKCEYNFKTLYVSLDEYVRLRNFPENALRGEINRNPDLTKSQRSGLLHQMRSIVNPEYRERCNEYSRKCTANRRSGREAEL